ncbi:hypothetical protein GCM10027321_32440 [Massilia terrae]|uniref:Lipoprotein n=1 Tax=Massilia terrae TaxID=1811224 RepID=A0ABT2CT13_9BURK|nr:hypothetical protein [Massilia terrae]MCS0656721.1 hypothetical protein [Massilia terrae]
MKRVLCILSVSLLAACTHDPRALNEANLTQALNEYLAKRGDLCLAKSAWPVDVSAAERQAGSRNALQMPVLERLGLAEGTEVADGRRYQLTSTGKAYFLARPAHKRATGNRFSEAPADLCAAHLSLDRLAGWETPAAGHAVATYTYKVKPAAWTVDPEVRAVFPMVDRIIRGAGTLQLKEEFVLGAGGWEALDL